MAEHGNVVYSFTYYGQLGGDWVITFELAHAFMPRHVSAVQTANDATATILIQNMTGTVTFLAAKAVGANNDPAEYGPSDFADADYQFNKGDIVKITISTTSTRATSPTIVITGLFGE